MRFEFDCEEERELMREVLDSALRVRVRKVTPVALHNLQTLLQIRSFVEQGTVAPLAGEAAPPPSAATAL